MGIVEVIDGILKENKMSRRAFAKSIGISPSTFQSGLEKGGETFSFAVAQKIFKGLCAISPKSQSQLSEWLFKSLGVESYTLIWGDGEHETAPWVETLAEQLRQIGFRLLLSKERNVGHIEFSDGVLDVTEEQMKNLSQSLNDFTRYAINDLRKKNPHDFWPKAGGSDAKTPGE